MATFKPKVDQIGQNAGQGPERIKIEKPYVATVAGQFPPEPLNFEDREAPSSTAAIDAYFGKSNNIGKISETLELQAGHVRQDLENVILPPYQPIPKAVLQQARVAVKEPRTDGGNGDRRW